MWRNDQVVSNMCELDFAKKLTMKDDFAINVFVKQK